MINMKDQKNLVWFIALYIVLISIACFFEFGGTKYSEPVKSLIYSFDLLIIAFVGIISIKRIGLDNLIGKSILLLMLSRIFGSLGGLLWPLFPKLTFSPSDGLWFTGYFLLYVGLSFAIQDSYKTLLENKKRIVFSIISIILFIFLYLKFFPITWDPNVDDLKNLVTVGYILLDLFLIVPMILLVFSKWGKDWNIAWVIISVSLLVNLVSDVLYNMYYNDHLAVCRIELTWFICYLAYAVAFLYMKPNVLPTVLTKEENPKKQLGALNKNSKRTVRRNKSR